MSATPMRWLSVLEASPEGTLTSDAQSSEESSLSDPASNGTNSQFGEVLDDENGTLIVSEDFPEPPINMTEADVLGQHAGDVIHDDIQRMDWVDALTHCPMIDILLMAVYNAQRLNAEIQSVP